MSLRNVLAVALGIFAAIGGFVDIGDLVNAGGNSAYSATASATTPDVTPPAAVAWPARANCC